MLILDANILCSVFDENDGQHDSFAPILKFILRDRGILASGGTTYVMELSKVKKVLGFMAGLSRAGQVKVFSSKEIDAEEVRVSALAPKPSCDDQHLIALVNISRAKVIASNDKRADKFIKDKNLYLKGVKCPSIYRCASHSKLLNRLPKLS